MNQTKKKFTALQHLSKRRDIIIKADKGKCIVVEDTETYRQWWESSKWRKNVYTPWKWFNRNSCLTHQEIPGWNSQSRLSQQVAEAIKPSTNPRTQQMYFLKKMHKHHQVYDQSYLAVMDQQNPYHNTWTTCYNQSHNNSNHTSETLKTSYNWSNLKIPDESPCMHWCVQPIYPYPTGWRNWHMHERDNKSSWQRNCSNSRPTHAVHLGR